MSTTSREQTPLDQVRVGDLENFHEGPPLQLFGRLRAECPVHWSDLSDPKAERGVKVKGAPSGVAA